MDDPFDSLSFGPLRVEVWPDRRSCGGAAAGRAAEVVRGAIAARGSARVVFAAAPSQNETLEALALAPGIDWGRVLAFHMDEYLGIAPDHPAAFRRYLAERAFGPLGVPVANRVLVPGESTERPGRVGLDYEEKLRAAPIDLVLAGIGENGHLAFNDPPVADFLDPLWVKVVRLDADCRRQQVNDGGFATIDEVPTHAYTLTVPALLSAKALVVTVPGPRKAKAVHDALHGPIVEACPASALRRHKNAVLYLDAESATLLQSPRESSDRSP